MEKIDLAFFGYIGIATFCVAITIVLVTNRDSWMPAIGRVVSFFSSEWGRMVERARQQKAAREQLYGYAAVNHSLERDGGVMSRWEDDDTPSRPPSLQTDNVQTDRQPTQAQPGRAELLTLYKVMRESGVSREKARPALKAVGLPLDNNLWAEAAPPTTPAAEPAAYVTPIVGRVTNARFETDPDFPYKAPA